MGCGVLNLCHLFAIRVYEEKSKCTKYLLRAPMAAQDGETKDLSNSFLVSTIESSLGTHAANSF